jgi:tetratricopeptide (TPR) repeat protein
VENLIERAERLYQTGQCDQAVDLLRGCCQQNPRQPGILLLLIEMLVDSAQYRQALADLPEGEDPDPDGRILVLQGICHEALGNIREAEAIASRLYDFDARRADALVFKARLAVRSGDRELAERSFREAIRQDETCALALLGLGSLESSMGNTPAALDCLEKALRLSPSSREIAIAFHQAAIDSSEYQRAESVFREALRVLPLQRRLRFLLIDLLLRQRQWNQAMAETESAMNDFGVDDGILSAALSVRRRIGPCCMTGPHGVPGTLSLCMIVKNEASCLARCLFSVKPLVDEMIVVDTGSTDATRDIAEAFGARVYEAPWENDFSKARNIALSHASGAWIFVLDADEVISANDVDAFKALVRNADSTPAAYVIQTRNYTYHSNTIGWRANAGQYAEEQGPGWFPSDKVRLFTNDPRIRFSNPVHELVEPGLRSLNVQPKRCDMPVHHYGKLQEDKTHSKTVSYQTLGHGKLESNRQSPSALREHAIQCAYLGKHNDALSLWKEFIKTQPRSAEAYVNMAASCWNLGSYAEAASHAEKALRIHPAMKEARFNRAVALLMLGQAAASRSMLQAVIKQEPNYPAAQFMLCIAHACLGEKAEAQRICHALTEMPMGEYLHVSFLEIAQKFFNASLFGYASFTLEAALGMGIGCAVAEMASLLDNCRNAARIEAAGSTQPRF